MEEADSAGLGVGLLTGLGLVGIFLLVRLVLHLCGG